MLKLLHSESKSVTGAALLIGAATLLSRLTGLARDRVFAHYFGTGPVMDAYYAAFKIPDLIYTLLIIGALTAGFIPTFTKLFFTDKSRSAAWPLANNVLNIIGVSLAVLMIVGIIAAPLLLKIIAPGFSGETRALTITFTRIMFLSPLLLGLSMTLGGILQSFKHFLLYAIAPIFYNLGIIIGATLLTQTALGVEGLAWGVALGALLHLLIQWNGARGVGWRWQWRLDWHDRDTRQVGRLMLPRTAGLAINQLNWIVVTILASLLPAGSVAVYNFAHNLQNVPTGLIGVSFALAVFPTLARLAGDKNTTAFIRQIGLTTRQILFLIIPCSLLLLMLRAQIVRVVLGSGAFDWAATIATANALAFFALGLFAQALIHLYARGFYALRDSTTPFLAGLVAEVVAIALAILLMKPYGVAGLALASSLGAILNALMLMVALRRKLGNIEGTKLLETTWKIGAAGLVMALSIQWLKYPLAAWFSLTRWWGVLAQGLVAGLVGLAVYGMICYLLDLDEIKHLQAGLKRRFIKLRQVPAGIDEAEGL